MSGNDHQPFPDPQNSMQRALRDVVNQMQVMQYRYENSPPLNRTEILAECRSRLAELDPFIGRKNGGSTFRSALISLAAYITFTAASMADKSIGVE